MIRSLVLLFLALLPCVAQAQEQLTDPGGDLRAYERHIIRMQLHGERVPLTGAYGSAAVEYLQVASCVAPKAQFWVHEVHLVRSGATYDESPRDEAWTQAAADMLPDCARRLFARGGGFSSPVLVLFTGSDVLQACPQIPSCAGR